MKIIITKSMKQRSPIAIAIMAGMCSCFAVLCSTAVAVDGGSSVVKKSLNEETVATQAQAEAVVDNDPMNLRSIPDEGQDIGVDIEKVGTVIDANLNFRDSNNSLVRLADLFDGTRPVMMSFNYSDCPKLCSVQLENMVDALREVDFTIGQDFDFISISIDPNEQSSRAAENKAKYLKRYNRPESSLGWNFWVGDRESIANITGQTGFRFKYVREQKLYSHPPVFILFSPEGKIVRYIHGLSYEPKTIKQALVEAAEGKIGSPINYLSYALGCFSYSNSTGQYHFQAMFLMRAGGLLTLVVLLIGLAPYWFFRRQSKEGREIADSSSGLKVATVPLNHPTS